MTNETHSDPEGTSKPPIEDSALTPSEPQPPSAVHSKLPWGQLAKLGTLGIEALGDDECVQHPRIVPHDK